LPERPDPAEWRAGVDGDHHRAMRRVNEALARDDRLDSVMLPVRDGVTPARRR
jgi:caffeoyl-CoA O-methyltransferase